MRSLKSATVPDRASVLAEIEQLYQQEMKQKVFSAAEEQYLLEGVRKMGHHWKSILRAYHFQAHRTAAELRSKHRQMLAQTVA